MSQAIKLLVIVFGMCWTLGCQPKQNLEDLDSPEAKVNVLAEECSEKTGGEYELTLDEAFPGGEAQKDWILVDARAKHEIEVSKIPNSYQRVAFETIRDEDPSRPILVYCTVGCRSGRYARNLVKQGYNAHNLKGGILAWALSGRELVDGAGNPTQRVHVVGDRWAVLPEPFEMITNAVHSSREKKEATP